MEHMVAIKLYLLRLDTLSNIHKGFHEYDKHIKAQ